jgi:hypothetical protein
LAVGEEEGEPEERAGVRVLGDGDEFAEEVLKVPKELSARPEARHQFFNDALVVGAQRIGPAVGQAQRRLYDSEEGVDAEGQGTRCRAVDPQQRQVVAHFSEEGHRLHRGPQGLPPKQFCVLPVAAAALLLGSRCRRRRSCRFRFGSAVRASRPPLSPFGSRP